jgi:hypothetical protein
MKPGGWPSPFLDDVFGRQLADNIRSLFGPPPHSDNPYGRMAFCDCGNNYLGASISSLWALLVVIIAFAAGMTFQFKKKLARWMLATGVLISVLDSAIRFSLKYNRYPTDVRQMMVDGLPGQVIANIVFQFAVPFAAGLLVALFADGVRRSVGWLLRRF